MDGNTARESKQQKQRDLMSPIFLCVYLVPSPKVVLFGAAHGMVLLPVILSWLGPMSTAHGALEDEELASQLEGDEGGKSMQHETGTATAAGPAEERTQYDCARVPIPPPSLSLKPTSSKLGSRGPMPSNNESCKDPRAALNSFLTIPSHQLVLNNSSTVRDRENYSTSNSPMRRTKSATASSRSGLGDLQHQKQDLSRHPSLLSRTDQAPAPRSRDPKQKAHSTNPVSACASRPRLPPSPEEHRRTRRWSCTAGSRIGDSLLQDLPTGRLQQQPSSAAMQGQQYHQKARSQQGKQLLPPVKPRPASSCSESHSSQDIRRAASNNGASSCTVRSHTYQ